MLTFYLLRSMKRRPLRHASMVWIMMCAFLLPMVVSVYRDSLIYGVQLQNYNFNKGQAIHILGALPEDVAFFQNIDGLTAPYFEDGVIYMTYSSQEAQTQFQDIHEQLKLSGLIKSKARLSKHTLEVMFYDVKDDILDDAYLKTTLREMTMTNLALLLLSGLIVQAAYCNHIDSFSEEIAALSAMGAAKGQIIRMFLVEFGFLFLLSSAGAVGISYGIMRLLYEKYLGNMASSAAIWRVFHMDNRSTMMQIGFYLLVCLGAMSYTLLKKPTSMRITKLQKTESLPKLWIKRTKIPFFHCVAILVPLISAFLILLNQYLGTYAKTVYSAQDAQIIIQSFTGCGFSQKEVDALSTMNGVDHVEATWDFSEPFILHSQKQGAMMVSLHLSDELPADFPRLEKNQFVSDFHESLESEKTYSLYRISSPGKQVEVKLAKRIPSQDDESMLNVYVSRELLQELALEDGYTKLIVHTPASQASAVEDELRHVFSEAANIFNYQNYVDTTILQQEGHLWLLSWIFSIIMVAAMQIVWVRLTKYVWDCAPMLKIVQHVGASRRQLSRLIPVYFGAIPGTLLPFLIAIPWAWLDSNRNARPFIISVPLLGIYLALAMLVILTFWLPIKMTLRKILE